MGVGRLVTQTKRPSSSFIFIHIEVSTKING